MLQSISDFWPHLAWAVSVTISLLTSGHAVLYKRDSRATIAWVGIIWLVPFVGGLLYIWLGINRIQRRAQSLRADLPAVEMPPTHPACSLNDLQKTLSFQGVHLNALVKLVGDVTQRPLLGNNRVELLVGGEEAYPAMLREIHAARQSVTLSTYIFNNDETGRLFLQALKEAKARSVEVRVLIDDVGSRYSWPRPSMLRMLHRQEIPAASFLPTLVPWRFRYSNLRNHRKILVVDGRVGFTGGMNLRREHVLDAGTRHPIQDAHFRIEGAVVSHLQETFAVDWAFATGEVLKGDPWFPRIDGDGPVLARGISEGPDEDFEKLRWTIQGALACAQSSVLIVNPYFLPDTALITALNSAAMRGVSVDIVLPAKNNLTLVGWASMAQLWQVLERGCRVWLSPPPFDHTKLLIVDGAWSLIGSANWDTRSLRLNFEFDVECYDRDLAKVLAEHARGKIETSKPLTLEDVDGRSLPVKLRDGVARLFAPYL